MIEINESSLDDFNIRIVNDLIKIYGITSKVEKIYELKIDGQKSYLIVQDNNFYIMSMDGVDHFSVVDNQVVYYHCAKNDIALKSGSVYKFDQFNRIEDYISIMPYVGEPVKYFSVNAALNHVHFDYESKLKFVLSYYYDANFDNKDRISESYFYEPFYVGISSIGDNKMVDKNYYLTHWYIEERPFRLALLKMVGFVDFFIDDYGFSYDGDIDVYYDRNVKQDYSLGKLLGAKQYDLDDVYDELIKNGLDKYTPPSCLIEAFNKEDKQYELFCEIYNKYMEMNKKDVFVHKLAM